MGKEGVASSFVGFRLGYGGRRPSLRHSGEDSARHSGGGRNPAPSSSSRLPVTVIPAKAGIHLLLLCFDRFGFLLKHIRVFFRPPSWRPGHFSLLAQREVTKRKGTPAVAVAGLLPGDCVRTLRGSLTAHPCAGSELGAIHRAAPFGAFSFAPSPRPRGTPEEQRSGPPVRRSGRVAALAKPSVIPAKAGIQLRSASSLDLGARVGRRRADGRGPRESAGEREGSRSFRSRTWMSCQRNPGRP